MMARKLSALAGAAAVALTLACASGRDNETGTTDETMQSDTSNTQMNRDTTVTGGMEEDTTGM